ncbi:MAG: hypothetical protein ACOYEB_00530 [Enterococcus lemanii]|jgi:hypothetical protein
MILFILGMFVGASSLAVFSRVMISGGEDQAQKWVDREKEKK